jgi:2-keto-4-pentenoate hydratase
MSQPVMPDIDPTGIAREVIAAYSTGANIAQPFSARFQGFDMKAAYAVEAEFMRLRLESGRKTTGLKVGYANKAVWRALRLDTLAWAHMYDDTVYFADGDGMTISLPSYESCKIEPEIVFKLKGTAGGEALDAVEWLAIGFEIIHCPFPDWRFQPADFVAAFGLHLALIVGRPHRFEPAHIPSLTEDLARFKVRVFRNDEVVEEGSGKNSLRSPALCLAELARVAPLSTGELVSSGTLTAGHTLGKDEIWRVDIEGLPLSGLTLRTR